MRPPFAAGSVSLGLTPVGETAARICARLVDEANLAVEHGFDGVTLSEHHAGFPGYLPSPLAVATALLGRMPRGWAVASPAILPLRPPVTVAEDLAWTAAMFPGRVGAGFVAGYQETDFVAVGADFASRRQSFWRGLDELVSALGGPSTDSAIAKDAAVADLQGGGLPLLAGVAGPVGARRAAHAGVGILLTSLRPVAEVAGVVDDYRAAGGDGPTVLIRRVHVGDTAVGFAPSTSAWRSRAGADAAWLDPDSAAVVSGTAEEVTQRLVADLSASGCTALNLRIDAHTSAPHLVPLQIARLAGVVEAVRQAGRVGTDGERS